MRARNVFVVPVLIAAVIGSSLVATGPAPAAEAAESAAWTPPAGETMPAIETRDAAPQWRPANADQWSTETPDQLVALSAPVGVQAAAPGVGERSWFAFEEFPLSSTSAARVNLANGNLLVTSTDLTLAAPGTGLRHDRFYNGLSSNPGTLGGGWGYNASTDDSSAP